MRLSNSEDRMVVGVPVDEKYCFTFRAIVVMPDFLRAVQVCRDLCSTLSLFTKRDALWTVGTKFPHRGQLLPVSTIKRIQTENTKHASFWVIKYQPPPVFRVFQLRQWGGGGGIGAIFLATGPWSRHWRIQPTVFFFVFFFGGGASFRGGDLTYPHFQVWI